MSFLSVGGKALAIGSKPISFPGENTGALTIVLRGNAVLPCNGQQDAATVCWPIYSGGVGPYTFVFSNGQSTINCNDAAAGYFAFISQSTGFVKLNNNGPAFKTTDTDIVTVLILDSIGNTASASFSVTYTESPIICFSRDYFLTNQEVSSENFISPQLCQASPTFDANATYSYSDPSGLFTVQWSLNVGYIFPTGSSWPPLKTYPITLYINEGSISFQQTLNLEVLAEPAIKSIVFVPSTLTSKISTSLPVGFPLGQANASDDDNLYQWAITGTDAQYFAISPSGAVTILTTPTTAAAYQLTIQCTDGTNPPFSETFTLNFVAGTTLPSSDMTANILNGLNNSMSSGTLTSPSVNGFTPTYWQYTNPLNLNLGGRYQINSETGVITIVGALSYQTAADGTSFEDQLIILATDGVNTCSKPVSIAVAASVGTTYYVGRADVLAAAGVTGPNQYATLSDAFTAAGALGEAPPTNLVPGSVFIIYSPPQSDSAYFTYFKNDGICTTPMYGIAGFITQYQPITIMGSGGVFPYFTADSTAGLSKGLFYGNKFDLIVKNLTVAHISDPGAGNLAGIIKENGASTGNLTVDNCYIHDCDNGFIHGCPGGKWFITNSRVSHCGVGSSGYTHNTYFDGDFVYINNLLSDQAFNGHLLKSRTTVSLVVKNSRLIDGQLGCASHTIESAEGGINTYTGNLLHKGPNGQNPFMMIFAYGGDNDPPPAPHNTLTANNNTLILDPGEAGAGNVMPNEDTNVAGTDTVYGIVNGSVPGYIDNVPAIVIGSGNSFYGLLPSHQQEVITDYISTPKGTNQITNSTTLTTAQRPSLAFTFPGTGPDPTVADPPGPFLQTWYGGVGGAQFTGPVDTMTLAHGAAAGTVVGTLVFQPGNTALTSPQFSVHWQSGPNSFAVDINTGIITTTATAVAQTTESDTICIYVKQKGDTGGTIPPYIWNFTVVSS